MVQRKAKDYLKISSKWPHDNGLKGMCDGPAMRKAKKRTPFHPPRVCRALCVKGDKLPSVSPRFLRRLILNTQQKSPDKKIVFRLFTTLWHSLPRSEDTCFHFLKFVISHILPMASSVVLGRDFSQCLLWPWPPSFLQLQFHFKTFRSTTLPLLFLLLALFTLLLSLPLSLLYSIQTNLCPFPDF